ncbi:hypothetical protein CK203_083888 [Vitis vinifera]|uniref:Secreted protein n=1 Tax=Vitis vinifera TaxID=29760 RepID=A0A438BUB2_VITVI|nr:hypothetical protein CK203_083888 [Vitis vinifera]
MLMCLWYGYNFALLACVFVAAAQNSENQLRLRLEEAEASLSTARGDNELSGGFRCGKSREESMDAACMRRRMRWLS